MDQLLMRRVANGISLPCALEHGRARLEDAREYGCKMRLFIPEARRRGMWISIAGRWRRQEAERLHRSDMRPRVQFLACSVTASGLLRRPAAGSLFCFGFTTPPHKERALGTPDCAACRLRFPSAMDPP